MAHKVELGLHFFVINICTKTYLNTLWYKNIVMKYVGNTKSANDFLQFYILFQYFNKIITKE